MGARIGSVSQGLQSPFVGTDTDAMGIHPPASPGCANGGMVYSGTMGPPFPIDGMKRRPVEIGGISGPYGVDYLPRAVAKAFHEGIFFFYLLSIICSAMSLKCLFLLSVDPTL